MKTQIDLTQKFEGYSNNLNDYFEVLMMDDEFARLAASFNSMCKGYSLKNWDDVFEYIFEREYTTYEAMSAVVRLYEPNYTLTRNLKLLDFVTIVKWDLYNTVCSMLSEIVKDRYSEDNLDILIDSGVIK